MLTAPIKVGLKSRSVIQSDAPLISRESVWTTWKL
jgi:hypothetical protein